MFLIIHNSKNYEKIIVYLYFLFIFALNNKNKIIMNYYESALSYSSLGYDVSMTRIYGKDAIRMVKRYSQISESPLECVQICEHEDLKEGQRLHDILDFMYNDIEEQEITKQFKKPSYEN